MTAVLKFDATTPFAGFTVTYKIHDDISKTLIIAESYRRLEMCLESLNFHLLQKSLRNYSFVIHTSIDDVKDGDVILISSLK